MFKYKDFSGHMQIIISLYDLYKESQLVTIMMKSNQLHITMNSSGKVEISFII